MSQAGRPSVGYMVLLPRGLPGFEKTSTLSCPFSKDFASGEKNPVLR